MIVAVETIAVVAVVVGGDVGRCCTTVCGNSTNTVQGGNTNKSAEGGMGETSCLTACSASKSLTVCSICPPVKETTGQKHINEPANDEQTKTLQ